MSSICQRSLAPCTTLTLDDWKKFVSPQMKFWIRKKGFETNPFNTCQQEIIVYNIDLIVVKALQNPSQFHLAYTFKIVGALNYD